MTMLRAAAALCALAFVAGCASAKVTERESYEGQRIARPDRIIVHDFAASAADIPPGSAVAGLYAPPAIAPTAEEVDLGRKVGAQVAQELVTEIRTLGLPAVQAAGQPGARVGDLVIMGYFEAVDSGSAVKRIALGFGSGSADLKTVVEGYLMTASGLRRLGSGEIDSGGGKGPGIALPLAMAVASGNPIGLVVSTAAKAQGEMSGRTTIEGAAKRTAKEIADQLQVAFRRQGWIQ